MGRQLPTARDLRESGTVRVDGNGGRRTITGWEKRPLVLHSGQGATRITNTPSIGHERSDQSKQGSSPGSTRRRQRSSWLWGQIRPGERQHSPYTKSYHG